MAKPKNRTVTVYGLASSEDGKIRYVGQTIRSLGARRRDHLKANTPIGVWLRKHPNHKIFIIDSDAVLHETERRLIAWYKAHGAHLLNLTEGGEGNHGYKWTPEQLRKISRIRTGRAISPEWRKNMSAALKGKPKPKGFGKKVSDARRGVQFTDQHRANIGAASLGRRFKMPDAARAKIAAAKRRYWAEKRKEQKVE